MAHDAPDRSLVARAAAGSEPAFRTLYRTYVRPVHRIAYGILGDAGDAEDVTQEAFVVAWRKLPGLELAGDSLLPWLATLEMTSAITVPLLPRPKAASRSTKWIHSAPASCQRRAADCGSPNTRSDPSTPCTNWTA